MDALVLLFRANFKGFHNAIANVFHVMLEVVPVPAPHYISQIEPKILLGVIATLRSTDGVPISIGPVYLVPSPKIFHAHILSLSERPLVFGVCLHCLLAHQKYYTILRQSGSFQDALCIFRLLVHVSLSCDFQVFKYPYH